MIFQEPMTSLNPVMKVGRQVEEAIRIHKKVTAEEAARRSVEILTEVGVPEAKKRCSCYPHQLSGGMRQRVLIAMAFAVKPKLIIADEPTTALDVTIQAQVLDLLKKLQKEHGTALILITHDLSVVAHMADTVHVMYSGKIVEEAPLRQLFKTPAHPYTQGLLASVPKLDQCTTRFVQIPDQVPNPMHKPSGCYFHPRCSHCTKECQESMPRLTEFEAGRKIRCHHPQKEGQ